MFRPRSNHDACGCAHCAARFPQILDRDFERIMHHSFGADEEKNLELLIESIETRDAVKAAARYV